LLYCLGSKSEVALAIGLGAYWFAMTLSVVSRLHRHASPESTTKVETVHPRVNNYPLNEISAELTPAMRTPQA
jgi:hypothetical protein